MFWILPKLWAVLVQDSSTVDSTKSALGRSMLVVPASLGFGVGGPSYCNFLATVLQSGLG